jgi:hypothetical protein
MFKQIYSRDRYGIRWYICLYIITFEIYTYITHPYINVNIYMYLKIYIYMYINEYTYIAIYLYTYYYIYVFVFYWYVHVYINISIYGQCVYIYKQKNIIRIKI